MRILLIIFIAMIVSACGARAVAVYNPAPATPAHDETADQALFQRGIEVYRANYCGSCHTLTAANTRGTFGPHHDNAGTAAEMYIALARYPGRATTAAEYIRESIVDPLRFSTPGYEATNHQMPAFAHLADEDLDALVYMLVQQRTGDQEPLDPVHLHR